MWTKCTKTHHLPERLSVFTIGNVFKLLSTDSSKALWKSMEKINSKRIVELADIRKLPLGLAEKIANKKWFPILENFTKRTFNFLRFLKKIERGSIQKINPSGLMMVLAMTTILPPDIRILYTSKIVLRKNSGLQIR